MNHSLLLERTKESFASVRSSIVEAMQNLWSVKNGDVWKETSCTSFGEYCESELGVSQSFASKLLQVNQHYLLEAGFSPEKIVGIDYECLYLAAKTEGTPEEQLARAKTLTRRELKETKNDTNPCSHQNHGDCCYDCWTKL